MKITFTGMIERKKGGCACRRKTGSQKVNVRTFFLPSGRMQTFRAGQVVEVSDYDGEFLLKETYTSPTGEKISCFAKV